MYPSFPYMTFSHKYHLFLLIPVNLPCLKFSYSFFFLMLLIPCIFLYSVYHLANVLNKMQQNTGHTMQFHAVYHLLHVSALSAILRDSIITQHLELC